jgi:hypothetical protein
LAWLVGRVKFKKIARESEAITPDKDEVNVNGTINITTIAAAVIDLFQCLCDFLLD